MILSRPFGTTPPAYLTQDFILGYSQSSLRDWFRFLAERGDDARCGFFDAYASRVILSRPFGTTPPALPYPGFHPGLFAVVPNGTGSVFSLRGVTMLAADSSTLTLAEVILSRFFGTTPPALPYPGFHPGLFSVVPNGTGSVFSLRGVTMLAADLSTLTLTSYGCKCLCLRSGSTQDWKSWERSAVPTGLLGLLHPTQDFILG